LTTSKTSMKKISRNLGKKQLPTLIILKSAMRQKNLKKSQMRIATKMLSQATAKKNKKSEEGNKLKSSSSLIQTSKWISNYNYIHTISKTTKQPSQQYSWINLSNSAKEQEVTSITSNCSAIKARMK